MKKYSPIAASADRAGRDKNPHTEQELGFTLLYPCSKIFYLWNDFFHAQKNSCMFIYKSIMCIKIFIIFRLTN